MQTEQATAQAERLFALLTRLRVEGVPTPYGSRRSKRLKEDDFLALWTLRERRAQGAVVGDVVRALGCRPAHVTRVVGRLEDRGFIDRRINAADRRKFDLELTAKGLAALSEHEAAATTLLARALEEMTHAD